VREGEDSTTRETSIVETVANELKYCRLEILCSYAKQVYTRECGMRKSEAASATKSTPGVVAATVASGETRPEDPMAAAQAEDKEG
jgi:hypothetical protein